MDVLLPHYHPLNSKLLRYSAYFIFYGVFHICPVPMILMAVHYTDQNEIKQQYEEAFQITMEGFWKDEVVTVKLRENPWSMAFAIMIVIAILIAGITSFGCMFVIYKTVSADGPRISKQMKRDRRRMLIALTVLVRDTIY